MEQQIQEVLDHIKSQPPPPPPSLQTPLSSAVVQTVEVKDDAASRRSPSPTAKLRRQATELERQLREERDRMRNLEDRNRAWQTSVSDQHRVSNLIPSGFEHE